MEGQVDVRARRRDDLRCPLCLDGLDSEEERAACATCSTPHHAACLRELGGCAILGCKAAVADLAPPDRERAAFRARAQQRARRFVKREGGDLPPDASPARHELRPALRAVDDDRQFWSVERWILSLVFSVAATGAFVGVLYLGSQQGWPLSASILNAAAAAVVVAIGGLFVAHARAPRR